MTDDQAHDDETEAAKRPAHPVIGGTLGLDPDCRHLFAPMNPASMVCMKCGGYASRERVRAWLAAGAKGRL